MDLLYLKNKKGHPDWSGRPTLNCSYSSIFCSSQRYGLSQRRG